MLDATQLKGWGEGVGFPYFLLQCCDLDSTVCIYAIVECLCCKLAFVECLCWIVVGKD